MKKLTAALIVILFLMNSASVQARGFDVADETIKEEIKELQEENSRFRLYLSKRG
jgi:ABC-type cobalt transport system substrate-binding protein